jgi:hypothetical protein
MLPCGEYATRSFLNSCSPALLETREVSLDAGEDFVERNLPAIVKWSCF